MQSMAPTLIHSVNTATRPSPARFTASTNPVRYGKSSTPHRTGLLSQTTSTRQLVIDPDVHTVHYGKALSKMHNALCDQLQEVSQVLNIEARGMEDIRANHPEKARMIVQAIDMARYYARQQPAQSGAAKAVRRAARDSTASLKRFFDVSNVDSWPARQNQAGNSCLSARRWWTPTKT
jgi:hypothetical protein